MTSFEVLTRTSTVATLGFVTTSIILGIVVHRKMIKNHAQKMDHLEPDEESVNDILDEDDDHENWSDFSIEEELPLQLQAFQDEIGQKLESCAAGLCQDCSVSRNCSADEQRDMSEEIVRTILEEVVIDLITSSPSIMRRKSSLIADAEMLKDESIETQDAFKAGAKSEILDNDLNGIGHDDDELISNEVFDAHDTNEQLDSVQNEQSSCYSTQALSDPDEECFNGNCSDSHEYLDYCSDESFKNHGILKTNDTNNNFVDDFAQALAQEVMEEFFLEVGNASKELSNIDEDAAHDPDELFLVLHPPNEDCEDEAMINDHKLADLEREVATLQECIDVSEANAEAAHIELVKEKAKSQTLQHELEQQLKIFQQKFELENEALEEYKSDLIRVQEEKRKEREAFQKTIQSLQKSLQEKNAIVKEKEESNSLLRKEAMDLVAR